MIGGRSSTSRVAASATALDRDTSVAVFGSAAGCCSCPRSLAATAAGLGRALERRLEAL
jgi:hypothetical protein